jgi:hypothetical protein
MKTESVRVRNYLVMCTLQFTLKIKIFFVLLLLSLLILSILLADINTEIINMSPVDGGNSPGSGGAGLNAPGSNEGGSPNPGGGPGWQPYHYSPNTREDGNIYPVNNPSPTLVLNTYNPASDVPVNNDKELGVLIDYRFNHTVRALGYTNWNVSKIFTSEGMVDKIAKERLLAHIYDHRSHLPTAYSQLDMLSGEPKWDSVKITSYLINSLNNSNN